MFYRIDWNETGEITEIKTREALDDFLIDMTPELSTTMHTITEVQAPWPYEPVQALLFDPNAYTEGTYTVIGG